MHITKAIGWKSENFTRQKYAGRKQKYHSVFIFFRREVKGLASVMIFEPSFSAECVGVDISISLSRCVLLCISGVVHHKDVLVTSNYERDSFLNSLYI